MANAGLPPPSAGEPPAEPNGGTALAWWVLSAWAVGGVLLACLASVRAARRRARPARRQAHARK